MAKTNKTTARDIENEMFDLYVERGPMTNVELLRAGYSQEQVDVHAPKVADRIRRAETARAA